MKYKAMILAAALAITMILTACGDRMTVNDNVAPDMNRPAATILPRATTSPKMTARPAATPQPAQSQEKDDNMLEDAGKDLERTADKVKDELSDGDGIVR